MAADYRELISELAKLHAPVPVSTVAVHDEAGWRDVDEGSFEGITSGRVNCMACAGFPQWPCLEASLLAQHGVTWEGRHA